MFGHPDITVYDGAVDTTATSWRPTEGGVDLLHGPMIAVVAASGCQHHLSAALPDTLVVGLRADAVGRTSARWGSGLFREHDAALVVRD